MTRSSSATASLCHRDRRTGAARPRIPPTTSRTIEVTFCVRGVISPLLANIYMHRFIKAFRKYGLDRRYEAVLVTYADDFVVLCRYGAGEVLEITRRWMASIGLTLNESKTRVCNARCESFDFLGYTFGPLYSPRTGGRYNGARPSKKAVARIKERIRQRLRPGNQAPWDEVVRALNRTVRGWVAYFSYGSVSKARHVVELHFVSLPCAAFSAAGTRWPGLAAGSFPLSACLGNWASCRSTPPIVGVPCMPLRETRPRAG